MNQTIYPHEMTERERFIFKMGAAQERERCLSLVWRAVSFAGGSTGSSESVLAIADLANKIIREEQ